MKQLIEDCRNQLAESKLIPEVKTAVSDFIEEADELLRKAMREAFDDRFYNFTYSGELAQQRVARKQHDTAVEKIIKAMLIAAKKELKKL